MSETILKILLSELKTIRLVCKAQDCGATVEVSLDQLGSITHCPVCNAGWRDLAGQQNGVYLHLANAIKRTVGLPYAEVQFVIPHKS